MTKGRYDFIYLDSKCQHKCHDVLEDATEAERFKFKNDYKNYTGIVKFSSSFSVMTTFFIFQNGLIHSLNGPALYRFDTDGRYSTNPPKYINGDYFIYGNPVYDVSKIYNWYTENNIDIDNITPEDEELIRMKWS